MGKFVKPDRVALVLNGRHAGKKVVVMKIYDSGTSERPYAHAFVVGIDRYPRKVTATMGKKKFERRTRVKAFAKFINYNHLMFTRYSVQLFPEDKAKTFGPDRWKNFSDRKEFKKELQTVMRERFLAAKNRWFFTKLRF
uniref:Large ribosomal subunit protein eL27 n=1 Tax=Pectinaria gouldii TaxID=260746 RepID=Q6R7S0_PECGU|nr:ribosomal protein L27 [Pectinaria gouldii]